MTGVRVRTQEAYIVPITGALAEDFQSRQADRLLTSLVYSDDKSIVKQSGNLPLFRQRYGPDRIIYVNMAKNDDITITYDHQLKVGDFCLPNGGETAVNGYNNNHEAERPAPLIYVLPLSQWTEDFS